MNQREYKLTYCEADTGVVLNRDGSRWSSEANTKLFQPVFESLEAARLLKDELLTQAPNGEVTIESEDDFREVYQNEERLKIYMEEREALFSWQALPSWIRIFKPMPKCTLYRMG